MIGADTGPAAYRRALLLLGERAGECWALAEQLDAFGAMVRGRRPDAEGPFLGQYPSAQQLRRALERRDRALDQAREAWDLLPPDAREGLTPPDQALQVEGR